jgi:hypothetical protein
MGQGLSRAEIKGLFDEIGRSPGAVDLEDGFLQSLGRFPVSPVLKHDCDCFTKPGCV